MKKYLGIDLGGTNVKIAIVDETGQICGQASVRTMADLGPEKPIAQIVSGVHLALESAGLSIDDLEGAGMGIPGNGVWPKGEVIICPNIGWHHFDAVGRLEQKLGISVVMGNDADCMAMAENRFGAGRNYDSFLMLTLGTGVGGAVIHEGKPFTGCGPCAGEFGYIPLIHGGYPCNAGPAGCLEEYCSIRGLRRIAEECGLKDCGPRRLFDLEASGDPKAIKAVELYTDLLSEGIAGIVNIFRPSVVIIGGGIAAAGAPLFDRLNQKAPKMMYAEDSIPAPTIIPADLGTYAGALGAAALAMV